MIAGEWAVLETGNPSITAAVDKYVEVELTPADKISLSAEPFDISDVKARLENNKLVFDNDVRSREIEDLKFLRNAIEVASDYFGELKSFSISTSGEGVEIEKDGEKVKLGFGSSAAVTVAAIAAILRFHEVETSTEAAKELIFKLAAIASFLAQGKVGSCFDIASSTYGGVIRYTRFDPGWLAKEKGKGTSIKEVVNTTWPSLSISEISLPQDFILLVGWTGNSASTSKMIKELYAWRDSNLDDYKDIFARINETVSGLVKNWAGGDKEQIISGLNENQQLLKELSMHSGVGILTPALEILSTIARNNGGAGKVSGAGGGDNGIAVVFDKENAELILKEWEQAGIVPIKTNIVKKGVEFLT